MNNHGTEPPSVIYHLTRPTEVARKIQGQGRERELIGPRRITLTPGGMTAHWQHTGHPEILHVYLRQQLFDAVAAEMYDCDAARVALWPRFAIQDPLLEELAITINDAMDEGWAGSTVFADTLARMVAAQLARGHSSSTRGSRLFPNRSR